jgi:two-component system CheB/CheR fusion protein
LLQRETSIPVVQVHEGMQVECDKIYLPPSNRELVIKGDTFHQQEAQRGIHPRLPIDTFLKSLAEDRGELAGCIILSGTGTDGTQGLRMIKEKGGVALAQSEESARYPGMPQSAIDTGLVDFILSPSEMSLRLSEYFSQSIKLRVKKEEDDREQQKQLQKIILFLASRTGHDFQYYKKSTLVRRIQRRMSVTRKLSMDQYRDYLYRNPEEIQALFQDLLIGVTSFFRDAEAFEALKGVLRELLAREDPGFRIWVPGCATGEEAYSVVILLSECLDELQSRKDLQIFGTDIDRNAIDKAREGVYPESIVSDVSLKRLRRFFSKEDDSYRVRKELREPIVFAAQDVLRDPPFSKLDLLVCRNLLIYLEARAQKKLLPLFHYALKPGGVLFLGSSESIGGFTDLFSPVNKRWNIYAKRDVPANHAPFVEFPVGFRGVQLPGETGRGSKEAPQSPSSIAKLVERILLNHHTPPAVVVNQAGQVHYFHGKTGRYLEPAAGHPSFNLIDMAREGLRFELSAALRKVEQTGEIVRRNGLEVTSNGEIQHCNLVVKRLESPESLKGLFLVVFEPMPAPQRHDQNTIEESGEEQGERIFSLERELTRVRQDHRTTLEELETSNEELKSVNEELQSSNEELQSTNEELESSREELQSLNEELSTVNSELHEKIHEVAEAYDIITDVLDNTGIAILFLDKGLTVRRFTQEATRLVKLIPSDIGRPIDHFSTNIKGNNILDGIRKVAAERTMLEEEIQTQDEHWYLMRIMPYRAKSGRLEGIVITFVDIAKQKKAECERDEMSRKEG